MTVARLIDTFSTWTKVVQVEDVKSEIISWGYCDGITIAPYDQPAEHLLGVSLRYTVPPPPYGQERDIRVVRYNKNLPPDWQRLVCVKELVHQLDDVSLQVSSKAQLSDLLDELIHKGKKLSSLKRSAQFEDIAIWQALAILCSEEDREELFHRYHENGSKISLENIAERFAIPEEYAGCLMLPQWKGIRDDLREI